jgi:hypothetical protein
VVVAEVTVAGDLVVEDLEVEVVEVQEVVLVPVIILEDVVTEGGDVEVIIGVGMGEVDMVGHGAIHTTRMI